MVTLVLHAEIINTIKTGIGVGLFPNMRSRIIYIRFCTIPTVLLRRIRIQNNEVKIKKLIVETLVPLLLNHEVYIDGAL